MHGSFHVNSFIVCESLTSFCIKILILLELYVHREGSQKEASWAWAKGIIVCLWLHYIKVAWNKHRAVRHKGLWDTTGSFVSA